MTDKEYVRKRDRPEEPKVGRPRNDPNHNLFKRARMYEGKNNLGLRDSEDEPYIMCSPSPGAKIQVGSVDHW